jgi:cyclohexadienyl dehydratase
VLCAVHPDKPFDFAEKAYWLQRDVVLKALCRSMAAHRH